MAEPYESPHYWCGALSQAIRGLGDWSGISEEALLSAQRALREYESSPVGRAEPVEIVGFAVVDRTGECYAIRPDEIEAIRARGEAIDYLLGAESSGHPRAGRWVRDRLPFAILSITAEEESTMLENGTPTLDREP